jgi:hypothetical protein
MFEATFGYTDDGSVFMQLTMADMLGEPQKVTFTISPKEARHTAKELNKAADAADGRSGLVIVGGG